MLVMKRVCWYKEKGKLKVVFNCNTNVIKEEGGSDIIVVRYTQIVKNQFVVDLQLCF